jgi:antitoxin component of MazEF toxin-antitoxin module
MAVPKYEVKERKIIKISGKRQITIPQKFYQQLGLESEVECHVENGSLVIRPISYDTGEFLAQIVNELADEGYSGEELKTQFALRTKQVKQAIADLLEEADEIATGKRKAASMDDVFEEQK